jgi:hypothetical protein
MLRAQCPSLVTVAISVMANLAQDVAVGVRKGSRPTLLRESACVKIVSAAIAIPRHLTILCALSQTMPPIHTRLLGHQQIPLNQTARGLLIVITMWAWF